MQLTGLVCAAVCVACLDTTLGFAQQVAAQQQAEPQLEPYHQHLDTRNGHNHSYPDRGAIIRDAPKGAAVVNYAGVAYRFHDGVWLEPRGPAYIVVAPPIGLVVPSLPTFVTVLARGGQLYLYCNDTFYKPRPELSGYEVVNEPSDKATPAQANADAEEDEPVVVNAAPSPQATPAPAGSSASKAAALAAVPVAAAGLAVAADSTGTAATGTAGSAGSTLASTPAVAARAASVPTADATASVPAAATNVAAVPSAVSNAAVPPTTATTAATSPAAVAPAAVAPAAAEVPAAVPVVVPTSASTTYSTNPAAAGTESPSGQPKAVKAYIFPKSGQTPEQQARDRYDCYRFAVAQTGYDPMKTGNVGGEAQADYERAQAACFDAKGYTVR